MDVFLATGGGLTALAILIAVLCALAPTRLAFPGEMVANAPARDVHDDIRLKDRLMRWSAWPKETKSTCVVDPETPDSAVVARTIFSAEGERSGRQDVVARQEGEEVAPSLVGPGPPHWPRLTFALVPEGADRTRVRAHLVTGRPRPFNVTRRFAGLRSCTREMHRKDLAGLAAFSEPPHRDAGARVVGRPPTGANPSAAPVATAARGGGAPPCAAGAAPLGRAGPRQPTRAPHMETIVLVVHLLLALALIGWCSCSATRAAGASWAGAAR